MQVTTTSYGQGHLDLATKLKHFATADNTTTTDVSGRPAPTKWAGRRTFSSIAEARFACLEDSTIWRVQINDDEYYYRPKLKKDKWNVVAEAIMADKSVDYSKADPGSLFWVRVNDSDSPTKKFLDLSYRAGGITELQHQALLEGCRIETVLTDAEFVRLYCS